MPLDTPDTIEIAARPWKHLGLATLGVAMTALSAAIAFDLLPHTRRVSDFFTFIGYVCVLFFGASTVLLVWRSLPLRGVVVTVSPDGIRDTRVAADFIPWTAVLGVWTWELEWQKFVVLSIDPDVARNLQVTMLARLMRRLFPMFSVNRLGIETTGLRIEHETLFEEVRTHLEPALDDEAGLPRHPPPARAPRD
jgi:hypothetical protein